MFYVFTVKKYSCFCNLWLVFDKAGSGRLEWNGSGAATLLKGPHLWNSHCADKEALPNFAISMQIRSLVSALCQQGWSGFRTSRFRAGRFTPDFTNLDAGKRSPFKRFTTFFFVIFSFLAVTVRPIFLKKTASVIFLRRLTTLIWCRFLYMLVPW